MVTFCFNTGVKHDNSTVLPNVKGWAARIKPITFEADAPPNARMMFLSNNAELPEAKGKDVIVREIFNTVMLSQCAYFKVNGTTP